MPINSGTGFHNVSHARCNSLLHISHSGLPRYCFQVMHPPEQSPTCHHRLDKKHVSIADMTQQAPEELGVVSKSIHAESLAGWNIKRNRAKTAVTRRAVQRAQRTKCSQDRKCSIQAFVGVGTLAEPSRANKHSPSTAFQPRYLVCNGWFTHTTQECYEHTNAPSPSVLM